MHLVGQNAVLSRGKMALGQDSALTYDGRYAVAASSN